MAKILEKVSSRLERISPQVTQAGKPSLRFFQPAHWVCLGALSKIAHGRQNFPQDFPGRKAPPSTALGQPMTCQGMLKDTPGAGLHQRRAAKPS